MSKTTIRRLASLELFADCRRAALERIDQMGVMLDVPAGRRLCDEGAPGEEFFVLVDGNVEVHTAAGRSALLRPGAWFGEIALLDRGVRRATVTARTRATVLVFGRREFNGLLAIAPSVRARLERTTAGFVQGAAPPRRPWYQPLPSGSSVLAFGMNERWSEA